MPNYTPRKRTVSKRVATADVVRLRREGYSYQAVADVLGVDKTTVTRHLKKAREAWTGDNKQDALRPIGPPKKLSEITDPEVKKCLTDDPEGFRNFCNRYWPEEPMPDHIWLAVNSAFEDGKWLKRVIINFPPNHAKTSYFNVRWCVWRILMSDRAGRYIVISESDDVARVFVGEAAAMMSEHEDLIYDFGAFNNDSEEVVWQASRIRVAGASFRRGHSILARGWNSQIQGLRAHEIICDDIFDGDSMKTEQARKEIVQKIQNVVNRRLEPGGIVRFIGTRQHTHDIYGEYAEKTDPHTGKLIYRHINFPALRDPETGKPSMLPSALPLWPERFDREWLMGPECFADMGDLAFQMTMQQNPILGVARIFQPDWIELCKRQDLVMGPENMLPDGYVRVIGLDPSGGVKKGAIIVADVGTTPQNFMDCFIREVIHQRMESTETERILAGLFAVYDPKLFVFESSGVIRGWQNQLFTLSRQYGVVIKDFPTGQGRGAMVRDPDTGTMEPGLPSSYAADIQFGRIHIPFSRNDINKTESTLKQAQRLIEELESFPEGRTTDCLMALAMIKEAWQRGYIRYYGKKSGGQNKGWGVPSWAKGRGAAAWAAR